MICDTVESVRESRNAVARSGSVATMKTAARIFHSNRPGSRNERALTAAGAPASNVTGYAFISTNFLNAHGASTLTDFKTFSFTPGIFVMPPPSANSRSNLKEGVEMLAP